MSWGIASLIVLTPLAIGSVEPWAFAAMEAAIFILVACWILKLRFTRSGLFESQQRVDRIVLPGALLVVLVAFQLIAIPPSVERLAFSSTFQLYQNSLPGWPQRTVYDNPLLSSKSGDRPVILPTVQEVATGTAVPFAKLEKEKGFSIRPLGSAQRGPVARWRPVAVDMSTTWRALLKLVAYFCIFLLVVSYTSDRQFDQSLVHILPRAALISGTLVASVALLEGLWSNGKIFRVFLPYDWANGNPWGSRATGSFANPDHLANYLDLVLPIAVAGSCFPAILAKRRRMAIRLFCAAAVVLIGSALLVSSSRAGWVGALLGFALLSRLWPKGGRRYRVSRAIQIGALASLGAFVLLALLFIGPGGRTQADARLKETVTHDSITSRIQPARISLTIVKDFPILGLGLGCWPEVFPHYSEAPWSSTFWNATHNDYVQLASETGVMGLGLLGWFFAAAFVSVWHGLPRMRAEDAALIASCAAGIGATAAHEFVDFPLQVPANALLFTVLLALAVRMSASRHSPQVHFDGALREVVYAVGVISIVALTGAAIAQNKVPYPYNVKQPATLVQAYSLVNAHPANSKVHLMVVGAMGEAAPIERRLEELRTAIWLEPTNPTARDLYAKTLLEAGDSRHAFSEMSKSIEYSPALDSHVYLTPRLIPWLSLEEKKAVERGFRLALANGYPGASENFASYYDTLGNFAAEAAVYGDSAAKAQDSEQRGNYLVEAGVAYAKAGELDKAEATFRTASAAVPENSTAYEQMLLRVFVPEKNLAVANATVALGMERGADPFKLYLALASVAQASGNSNEAEAALQQAIRLQPSNFEALLRIGALNLMNHRFDRAAMWLQQAQRADPSSAEAFYELGLAEEGAYEYFAAEKAYQQALDLSPGDARLKERYTAFRQKLAQIERDAIKP